MVVQRRSFKWEPVREHFLTAPERPTWNELETQFGIPADRIRAAAGDEGWVVLRAKKTAALVERSGVHEMLLDAARHQQLITDKFCGVALGTVEQLEKILSDLDGTDGETGKKLAVTTRSNTLNTVSFALLNLANALKNSGVVGLPRALMNQIESKMPAGEEGKEFLKTALQQINLTVNLAREGKPIDSVSVEPIHRYPRGGIHAAPRNEKMAERQRTEAELDVL